MHTSEFYIMLVHFFFLLFLSCVCICYLSIVENVVLNKQGWWWWILKKTKLKEFIEVYRYRNIFLLFSRSYFFFAISIDNPPDEWVSCRLRILSQVDVHIHVNIHSITELTETYRFHFYLFIYIISLIF